MFSYPIRFNVIKYAYPTTNDIIVDIILNLVLDYMQYYSYEFMRISVFSHGEDLEIKSPAGPPITIINSFWSITLGINHIKLYLG